MNKKTDNIFNDRPDQWGLRGDPYLWEELSELYSKLDYSDSFDIVKFLINSIKDIVSEKGTDYGEGIIFIEGFPTEGMSGGKIYLDWWYETGIPILLERYNKLEH